MASTELIKAGEESPFAVLRMEPDEIQELIAENIGSDALTPNDLDRVKVPSGGGSVWEVPSVDGIEATKVIEGVIIYRATRRAYWQAKYEGGGEQPDCFSDNGITGLGEPGGECAKCPFNEFGSGTDAKGNANDSKACKEIRQLFVLPSDSLIPIVVNVPPGSLANVKSYFLRLLRAQLKSTDVVTHIGLELAESKAGIKFSRVTLAAGARLEPEAAVRLQAYAASLEPAIKASVRVERSEIEEDA